MQRVDELLRSGTLPDAAPNGGSILAFARATAAIDRLLALGAKSGVQDRWGSTPIDAMSRLGSQGEPLERHLVPRGIPADANEYARLGVRNLAEHEQGSVIEFLKTLQVLPPGTESLIVDEDGQPKRWPPHRHGTNWTRTREAGVRRTHAARSGKDSWTALSGHVSVAHV